jgi:hypothetical protein
MTTSHGTDADTMVAQYNLFTDEIRILQRLLNASRAAQFSPPPGGTSDPAPNGIPNPTLDTVIDPRRMRLSQAMRESGAAIADLTARVAHVSAHLSSALSGWEGK